MNSDAWFRCWTKELKSGIARLRLDEAGAYLHLLLDYYDNGPLPNDPAVLASIARCPTQDWARVWGALSPKFNIQCDNLCHNERCDAEIAWRKEQNAKRHEQTAAARAARGLAETPIKPHIPPVTSPVTTNVTERQQSMSHSLLHAIESESESEYKKSTTKLQATKPTKLSKRQKETADLAESVLGKEWTNDAGKWIGRIKGDTIKVERVMCEVGAADRLGEIKTTPAAYAEDCWKRFK